VNKFSHKWSLSQGIKVLEELNCILDCGNVLKGKCNNVLEGHLEVLDMLFEHLTVVIMPLSLLDIKDVVGETLYLLEVALKCLL
jgi:uncharacterized membrane protein